MKKTYIFHPFLLAVFPLLSYYNHNKQELTLGNIFLSLMTVILSFALYYLFLKLFVKNKFKRGVIASLSIFMFFSYGHLMIILEKGKFVKPQITESLYPVAFWLLILSLFIFLIIKSKKKYALLSEILNIVSIALVVVLVLEIGYFEIKRKPGKPQIKDEWKAASSDNLCNGQTCRDIYYLIVERYANNTILQEYFHHDNSDFTSFLEEQGFLVPEETRANYLNTSPSLASSLNMEYLDDLAKQMGKDHKDRRPMYRIIEDNKVLRYLKSKGYKFINVGAYWPFTVYNRFANINYKYEALGLSGFSRNFLQTTILYPILIKINATHYLDVRVLHYNLSLDQIDKLIKYSKEKGPKYVFAHLYITHSPYVFYKNGEYMSKEEEEKLGYKTSYVQTHIFATTKLKNLIEKILLNSKKKPIIILQADEGALPERHMQDIYEFNWKNATKEEFRVKTGILNAYYLPGMDNNIIYPSITPVNTFRLIFNHYFGENFTLLPDQTFAHQDYSHPYKFWEITQLFQ